METNDDKRHQLLVEMMSSSGPAGAREGNENLLQPWRRLSRHLSPLIGESGFCALYGRASRLVQPEHTWLAAPAASKSIDGLVQALGDTYATVGTATAHAANAALLNTFTQLLSDLIGDALTTRLLHAAAQGDGGQKQSTGATRNDR